MSLDRLGSSVPWTGELQFMPFSFPIKLDFVCSPRLKEIDRTKPCQHLAPPLVGFVKRR